jgi:ribosome-binding protein aMBF1 (putative translation factor)
MGGFQGADGCGTAAASQGGGPRRAIEAALYLSILVKSLKQEGVIMATKSRVASPIGTSVSEARKRRSEKREYREAQERLAPYEQLARIVIRRRTDLGLTQEQLADRMGTSHSAISRIESGQHSTSVQTLQRLGEALEMRFVMGFEYGPEDKPVRELVPG